MIGGLTIELGWCGFGADGDLFPEVRLGVLRVGTYHGSLIERVKRAEGIARAMVQAMRDRKDGE